MTLPREILPGRSYLITRRCTQRQFLLHPSRVTNQNVQFCLGLASERTGVLLHAVCFMSNHWHGVITDPEARLPEFLETFHKLLAKVQNASLGRCENLWSSDKTSVVLLVSEQDVVEKMAYTLANPTLAGLVRSPTEWPGVVSQRIAETHVVEMPDDFFDDEGDLPDTITLAITRPPIFASLDDGELQAKIFDEVGNLVRRARDSLARRGLAFLGRKHVLRESFTSRPTTPAPQRNLNPRIAAKAAPARIAALRRMLEFVRAYRAAWQVWRSGTRDIIFPPGTYALRVHAGVRCAPA